MPDRFPNWAPNCLVKDYERNSSYTERNEDQKILKKLLSDNRMNRVWKAIEKRSHDESDIIEFYVEILSAYRGPDDWEIKTIAEKEKWKKNVINLLSKLNSNLKEPTFRINIFHFIPFKTKVDILKELYNHNPSGILSYLLVDACENEVIKISVTSPNGETYTDEIHRDNFEILLDCPASTILSAPATIMMAG